MTELTKLSRPKMRTAAGFHADQARLQVGEKPNQVRSFERFAQHRLASLIHPVHLKDKLCQIDSNRRNVHRGRSCLVKWLLDTSTLAHLMPLKAGASIPLVVA
jgi:hypothetical protein